MELTVKELAKISKVSVRTLHWYDEIGLLKPAFTKSNGYRFYGENELLRLQQILFFRELGFSLKEIERVISSSDFNQLKALANHKAAIIKKIKDSEKLIETIDKTIKHIKGKITMDPKEVYYGFDSAKQKEYDRQVEEMDNSLFKKGVAECKERVKKLQKSDFENHADKSTAFYKKFAEKIQKGCEPDSKEVQEIMPDFEECLAMFYTVTPEVLIGLGDFYRNNGEFTKFFRSQGVDMEFLIKAMNVYAKSKQS